MSGWLAIVLPLLLAYAPSLWWCAEMWWRDDGYYSHGPLVPLLMAAVLWWRRQQWQRQPARFDRRGFWLLGPALLLHLCGAALTIDSLSAASLVLAVPGAAWLWLGRARLAGQWPSLWLPLFAVPLPLFVSGRLAFQLKEAALFVGLHLAQATGLSVVRDGTLLRVPGQTAGLLVADPCGGLRSLLAMLLLAYVVAFLLGPPRFWRRTVLLLAAMPLALALNGVRIGMVCWFAAWWGVPFASGTGHDLLNALAWVLDLVLIFGLDAWLSRGGGASAPAAAPDYLATGVRVGRGTALLLWSLGAVLLLLGVYRPYTESMGRAAQLPQALSGFTQDRVYDIPAHYFDLLGTNDATQRRYRADDGSESFVVAVFHGANWKSVHPPHICLEGSDMTLVVDDQVLLSLAGEAVQVGHLRAQVNATQRPYVGYYVFGSKGLLTGSYLSFFCYHAPRALFRASNAGFLLRVESYGDGPGGIDGAERRCQELLRQLLPKAQELVR